MDTRLGESGETAEWLNVLLATFWSLLQPWVTRWKIFLGLGFGLGFGLGLAALGQQVPSIFLCHGR